MKLVFFSFAFLFGVLLIHAQEAPALSHAALASQPSAAKTQPETPAKTSEQKVPETSAHDSKSGSQDKKSDPEHSESTPPKSSQQMPEVASTKSSPHPPTSSEPSPKPTPPPTDSWNVIDPITNVPCIMITGNITLNGTAKNETQVYTLEPGTKVSGDCKEKYIRWDWGKNSSLKFLFAENTTTKQVFLSRVDGQMTFNHTDVGFNKTKLNAFETPVNKSFVCAKSIELPLVREKGEEFTLIAENVRVQAFKTTKSKDFDDSIDGCPTPSGGGPDVIPIVVGCALAILVVIVLVAYLINRRRSQAHGYLSM